MKNSIILATCLLYRKQTNRRKKDKIGRHKKENAETFEENIPRKYEVVKQKNGRWLIQRAQTGIFTILLTAIVLSTGCVSSMMKNPTNRHDAFLVRARKQNLRINDLPEYRKALMQEQNRYLFHAQISANVREQMYPTGYTYRYGTGLQPELELQSEILLANETANLVGFHIESVEYFMQNPDRFNKKQPITNWLVGDYIDRQIQVKRNFLTKRCDRGKK